MKYTHLAAVSAFLMFLPLFPLKAQAFSTVSVAGGVATITIQSDKAIPNALIDVEIYQEPYGKMQQVYVNTDIPAGILTCTWNATFSIGSNVIKVGTFSSDWSTVYNWNNYAAVVEGPHTGDNAVHCSNEATSAPSFTTSAKVEGYTSGANGVFTTTVQSTQNVSNVLIDTEIYNDSNTTKVGQWFETANLVANVPLLLKHASTLPKAIGFYYTKVGVFAAGWSKLYSWNENADVFKISPDPAVPYFESSVQAFGFSNAFDPNATIYSTIFSSQNIPNVVLDTEVYDASGHKVLQHFATQDLVAGNAAQLQWDLSNRVFPDGQYTFKTGVFSSDWSHLYHWNENAGSITIDRAHLGALSLTLDPSFPKYQIAAGGTTGVSMGKYIFHASNEAVAMKELGLVLVGYATSSDVQKVYLYDGSTLVGTTVFVNPAANITFPTPIIIPKDSDKVFTIKADFSRIGTAQPGVEGDLVQIGPTLAMASGVSSGAQIYGIAPGFGPQVRIFRSFPVIRPGALSASGVLDGRMMQFTVTASSIGNVALNKLAFVVATTSAHVSNLQLFAFNDAGYSVPKSGQSPSGQIGATVNNVGSSVFTFTPDTNPLVIPAGSSVYFQLRGTVDDVQPGSLITTSLVGDAIYDGMVQAGAVKGNLVWSPNATTTSTIYDNDWTNGYGIDGLPTSGLMQTRTY